MTTKAKPTEKAPGTKKQSDAVDTKRGLWPFDSRHPKDAEIVTPARMGGPDTPAEHAPPIDDTRPSFANKEPKGNLPPHRQSAP
jgi:hypothetical protein